MQSPEHLQSLLDNIASCSAEKLPDFIYGYSKCSPAEQKGLITMMSFKKIPSRVTSSFSAGGVGI